MSVGKKKDRYVDGVKLADNLYPDHHGRPGWFRYHRPDRTFRSFQASSVEAANELAAEANERRSEAAMDPSSMTWAVNRYIDFAERMRPSLKAKASWRNRKYAMRAFGKAFPHRHITERAIWNWWDELTHAQQILREAEFRRMWTFFQREALVAGATNPFDRGRILRREKPDSPRERLTLDGFWKTYAQATTGTQIGMGLSLLTTMRLADVATLTRANIQDGRLRKVISKSEEKRGEILAARLEWELTEHPDLAALIKRGLSTQPAGCRFIVHERPRVRKMGKTKEHPHQMLPRLLSTRFNEARDAAGVGGENPPTFHEIRSLGSFLLAQQGEEVTDVQQLMAHSSEDMTKLYQSGHPLPWQKVQIRLHDVGGEW